MESERDALRERDRRDRFPGDVGAIDDDEVAAVAGGIVHERDQPAFVLAGGIVSRSPVGASVKA